MCNAIDLSEKTVFELPFPMTKLIVVPKFDRKVSPYIILQKKNKNGNTFYLYDGSSGAVIS